jgi:2-polyprenyl-3-methyl-5-hydroxy-6-metoxy-1,4-benzoquinol methylase
MSAGKRTDPMDPQAIQSGNRAWWSANPMTYDWRGERASERFSEEWFDDADRQFVFGARLFATKEQAFDRIIPYERLAGARVLEIGCGMGLHTELLVKAGAKVTAVDISSTSIAAVRHRLALRKLQAQVIEADAEALPFDDESFDFVWSWGVIHHSSRTAIVVRQIARVLAPHGETRVMVYNRSGMSARVVFFKDHLLKGAFLHHSFDETLCQHSDGFSARYYTRDQFEDLFRAFFRSVNSTICGQDADVVPLPRQARRLALKVLPQSYLERAQATRGGFIFLTASDPR